MKLLVTGGAGFIGSAFVRLMLASPDAPQIINLDKLTYAGNLENLKEIEVNAAYQFVRGDICDVALVKKLVASEKPDAIVHFAAESHVDRSILAPDDAFETNLRGSFNLLEAARVYHLSRFVHVSTDEVYGSLTAPIEADETFPLNPSSPYSSSKAGSDLLARSYFITYRVPVLITRASNNYGPYQFPEKLIPLMISNALEGRTLPVYGDGLQVRDWLHVDDHCRGIRAVLDRGKDGEIYNIGGSRALPNIDIIHKIVAATGASQKLIQPVEDRPGHDRRYALSSAKIQRATGWQPEITFEEGLSRTIDWYRTHRDWVTRVKSGDYRHYYARNYENRASELHKAAGARGRLKP